jgi:hypothetical protein
VKRYESIKAPAGDGTWRHERITLCPDTDAPGYQPIVLDPSGGSDLRVIAEMVEALPGTTAGASN